MQNLELAEGPEVVLYMRDDVDAQGNPDCLDVDAIVRYDAIHDYWLGVFDWEQLAYRSEKDTV